MPDAPVGFLDTPGECASLHGPAVTVAGWVVFPDAHVDIVEVFRDGEYAGRGAWGNARPDIRAVMPGSGIDGLTSGFRAVVPVPVGARDRACTLQVRITASDRSVWCSPQRTITIRAEPDDRDIDLVPPDDMLAGRGVRRASRAGRRRRWCVFTHALSLGGGELYLQELLLRLQSAGNADILVVAPAAGPLRRELEEAGIRVHITAGYPIDAPHYAGRMAEYLSLIRAWNSDVVLINTLGLFPPADAAIEAGLPVIWAIHESFPLSIFSQVAFGPGAIGPAVRDRWQRAMLGSELVYEAETTLALHAAELRGVRARRIMYGIDLHRIERYRATHDRVAMRRRLGFRPGDRVLLCMGVIQERKGQIPLLRAFREAVTAGSRAHLVFVGYRDGDYPNALRECVTHFGLEDRVKIIDIDPDTYRWYHVADVLVSASDIESLPRSILEAHAFGLPVLAADVFGVGEVVEDGVTGWLFEPRRAVAMTTAVARVLSTTDAELAEFAERALAASAGYDGAGYARAYEELADELCGGGRADAPRAAQVSR